MSQEQKDRVEQTESDIPVTPPAPPTEATPAVEETQKAQEGGQVSNDSAPAKKRGKRKTRLVNVEEISPRPSYWPLALAFSLAIVLFGVIAGPVFIVIGVLLAFVAVGGWILERR